MENIGLQVVKDKSMGLFGQLLLLAIFRQLCVTNKTVILRMNRESILLTENWIVKHYVISMTENFISIICFSIRKRIRIEIYRMSDDINILSSFLT